MASIFITYGLLGFPFLFGLMEDSAVNDRKNAAGAVIGKKTQLLGLGFIRFQYFSRNFCPEIYPSYYQVERNQTIYLEKIRDWGGPREFRSFRK